MSLFIRQARPASQSACSPQAPPTPTENAGETSNIKAKIFLVKSIGVKLIPDLEEAGTLLILISNHREFLRGFKGAI